jgi:hypothetical protein
MCNKTKSPNGQNFMQNEKILAKLKKKFKKMPNKKTPINAAPIQNTCILSSFKLYTFDPITLNTTIANLNDNSKIFHAKLNFMNIRTLN